ncbi:MAG: DUF6602 domain-containing protein [Acetobacteraceae bacterium]
MPERVARVSGAGWKTICEQQKSILKDVEALRVSRKPEIIGALFENSFRDFLLALMPLSLGIVPGFIIDRQGRQSSHFDALVVDRQSPSLARIGPHHYVMSNSVVAVFELTTKLDAKKMSSIISKAAEIERLSRNLYSENSWSAITFMGVAVDSSISGERILGEFGKRKPLCHLYTLEAPHLTKEAVHCWMEGGKEGRAVLRLTTSPLADLVTMHFQDALYTLGSRLTDAGSAGRALNDYIHWGTTGFTVLPRGSA